LAARTPQADVPLDHHLQRVGWHVDDIDAALERLAAMGATEYEPKTVWEEGFVTASVLAPFGNVLGVTYNPHYPDMLARVRA
jgi:hypothetical protein